VLNIPRNDPILAKGNFAIAPISLRFRSAMKDVSRQTKKITSILLQLLKRQLTLETTNGSTVSVWIAEGTILYLGAYITFSPFYRWIDNNNESIILIDAKGEVVDRTPVVNDNESDNEEAKEFVNETCMWEEVKLDVDDEKQYDTYYRILAVVYVNETNLNAKLVKEGYAEVMYIPPSEFDCREWGYEFICKACKIFI
jgi:hypothetical protein